MNTITVKQSASDLDDIIKHAMGGELGTTLFCAGLRVWIPSVAQAEDIDNTIAALERMRLLYPQKP